MALTNKLYKLLSEFHRFESAARAELPPKLHKQLLALLFSLIEIATESESTEGSEK